jgi:ferredoxin
MYVHNTPGRLGRWIFLVVAVLYAWLVYEIVTAYPFLDHRKWWSYGLVTLACIVTYLQYKSSGLLFDFMVAMTMIWWFLGGLGLAGAGFVYFPIVTGVLGAACFALNSRPAALLAWLLSGLWIAVTNPLPPVEWGVKHYLLLGSSAMMLLLGTAGVWLRPKRPVGRIDLLLCSFSGNTAHFSESFVEGARDGGAEVRVQRFHHYKDFQADLAGDALVIAFPIAGFKPPWPFFNYLVFRLPRGRGKPAGILYTCIGGAENAGLLCWLLLTLKGYRVIGRNWAAYPINVATFRLGPRRLWRWLDRLGPSRVVAASQYRAGRDFAAGDCFGIPWVFGLTPGFLLGILVDNKWFDRVLYRNHVFKKRCNQCGVCVRYCPAERLYWRKGYPRARGECALCLGCVNLCPTRAMHLLGWTEYGQPYPPRWRKGVVRKKPAAALAPASAPTAVKPAGGE